MTKATARVSLGRPTAAKTLPALLCLLALALSASPALAARGHVFTATIGEQCATEPCEGAKLKAPSGIAVNEASGDLYVLDAGEGGEHGRVVRFNSAGVFQSELKGPAATGSGSLEVGASTVTALVKSPGGEFSVGEEITATEAGEEGLPPGTRITAVEPGTLKLSNPASKKMLSAELKAHQSFSFPSAAAETSGIAVDNSCHVQRLTEASEPTCKAADPSNEDVYVADVGHHLIDKFTSGGEYLGQITKTPETVEKAGVFFLEVLGVAVDMRGALWLYEEHHGKLTYNTGVDDFSGGVANAFSSFRETSEENGGGFGSFRGPGIAVDGVDNLYLAFGVIAEFSGVKVSRSENGLLFAKLLREAVDTEPSTGVATEVPGDTVYIDHEATLARFDAKGLLLERLEVPGKHGGGLAVSAAAETLYVADPAAGMVKVASPKPPGPATAAGDGVADVSSTSAAFSAEVNPQGAPTEYRFEYGACSSTPASCASSPYPRSIPEPEGLLAPSFDSGVVSAHPQDLTPHTVYHFRVLAHNANAPGAEGKEVIFTTQSAGGEFQLPDGRQWELVSPPDKHGAQIEPINPQGIVEAAAAGEAFTFIANAPTESQPEGFSNSVQVLAARGSAGWVSRDIASPHLRETGKSVGQGNDYRFFDEKDLSAAVVQQFAAFTPSISPEASEQTAFLHTSFANASSGELCASSCFHPLVTGANDTASPFVAFGEEGQCPPKVICGPTFVGASPDASHIILSSKVPLTAGEGHEGGLYEWAAGKLTFIGGGVLGLGGLSARRAVSDDGSRVFFEGGSEGLNGLLVRDTAASKSARLDVPAPGCEPGCESGGGKFQIASRDGSAVFFTDEHRLTSNSGASTGNPSASDLYVCEFPKVEGPCVPRDLTPKGQGGAPADVLGGVLGASNDGSWVYFAANGILGEPSGAVSGECERPNASASALCNLYVVHREGGVWGKPRFITVLSQEDKADWSPELNHQPARVSSNGQWLAFMSQRSLTGYDNRDALSGQRDKEVFLFDASRPVSVGVPGVGDNPACASCNPTGARPHGRELGSNVTIFANEQTWSTNEWLAANIPGWTRYSLEGARYQPRYLSDSGRLFFNSNDALVPQDVNGTEDVYQYEPAGSVNGEGKPVCTQATVTFSERSGGCVGLISSGSGSEESAFLDASENGSDVFFLTSAKLAPQDVDTSDDVYDAHECTTAVSPCVSPPSSPPPCTTEASCKPSPSPQPQIFAAPPSATFNGIGNVAPPPAKATKTVKCRRGLVRKHGRCAKAHKHKRTKARKK